MNEILNDKHSVIVTRKNAALFLIKAINEDKENTNMLWKEIHRHAFVNATEMDQPKKCSVNDISLLKNQFLELSLSKEFSNNEDQSNIYDFEIDDELQDLFYVINQLNLEISGIAGEAKFYSAALNKDSGYSSSFSEEIKLNYELKLRHIVILVQKIYKTIIHSTENSLFGTGIKLIGQAVEIHNDVLDTLNLLIADTIEEIPFVKNENKNNLENRYAEDDLAQCKDRIESIHCSGTEEFSSAVKCFKTEKVLRIVQEYCKCNNDVATSTMKILYKKISKIVNDISSSTSIPCDYGNLFHIIRTLTMILTDFELSLKGNVGKKDEKVLNDKNTENSMQIKQKSLSVVKKMNKSINKNIEQLQRNYHVAQIWLMLRRCSYVIDKILKNHCK